MSEQSGRGELPRAVIDTNVLLLGMFTRGLSLPIIEAWTHDRFVMVTSGELLNELAEVSMRPKFKKHITKADAEKLLELIYRKADIVTVTESPTLGRDADDYPVLGTALAGNATCIVTADKDLLDDAALKAKMKHLGVEVVTAGEFWGILKAQKY